MASWTRLLFIFCQVSGIFQYLRRTSTLRSNTTLMPKNWQKKRGKTLFNWPFNPISPQYFQNPKPEFQVVADPSLIGTYKLNNPLLLLGLHSWYFLPHRDWYLDALFTSLQPIWFLATTKKNTYSFLWSNQKAFHFIFVLFIQGFL